MILKPNNYSLVKFYAYFVFCVFELISLGFSFSDLSNPDFLLYYRDTFYDKTSYLDCFLSSTNDDGKQGYFFYFSSPCDPKSKEVYFLDDDLWQYFSRMVS